MLLPRFDTLLISSLSLCYPLFRHSSILLCNRNYPLHSILLSRYLLVLLLLLVANLRFYLFYIQLCFCLDTLLFGSDTLLINFLSLYRPLFHYNSILPCIQNYLLRNILLLLYLLLLLQELLLVLFYLAYILDIYYYFLLKVYKLLLYLNQVHVPFLFLFLYRHLLLHHLYNILLYRLNLSFVYHLYLHINLVFHIYCYLILLLPCHLSTLEVLEKLLFQLHQKGLCLKYLLLLIDFFLIPLHFLLFHF